MVGNQLLTKRANATRTYKIVILIVLFPPSPSPSTHKPTAIIKRNLFADILKQIVEEESSANIFLAGSTGLEVQQTSYVNTVLTLCVGG